MIYPDLNVTIPESLGNVCLVGIGGSGMSGIARMLHAAGVQVSGSDRSENANTRALQELGISIGIGHDEKHAHGADTLVVTGALWQDNPEYQYALRNNIPVLHRSQALAWLSRGKRTIAVAGAHGKTTSTGMTVNALHELKRDPSFVNGGVIESLGVSAAHGDDDLFVLEADESDKSFLLYDTAIALITNVDPEHLDFYGSREAFMDAFVEFADGARERIVISGDDAGTREILPRLDAKKVFTFGESEGCDLRVVDIDDTDTVRLTLEYDGQRATTGLSVYGRHNAVNAAGVVGVLLTLGFTLEEAAAAVASFGGTRRRFEFHGEVAGVRVYDDYAHHPTEVEALLSSIRPVVGEGRLIAIHQPHLFSRTQMFAQEFANVLEQNADYTLVLAIDAAREDPVEGVTGEIVSSKFRDETKVSFQPEWQGAAEHLAEIARPGDVCVTMSCGTVYQIIPQLLESLERKFA
ncbi:UDP-N-acetylmuramate--L-alanine ligase [Leucobacter chinensis]|uniref:UDP-N-acetylmuramate--L-alanine ligase n=1 Tax=Leucobacter chinensis TaxID=2851010 RepID=UPI001C220BCF|nr:UDP-N-acetylmuramate--L-alanine ligase [Leucobacter chinensis]